LNFVFRLGATFGLSVVFVGAAVVGPPGPAGAASASAVDPDASVAYQHDPAHDGNSVDPSFVAPLIQTWSKDLGGVLGYPLIADGRVFVPVEGTTGEQVEALSLATGDVLWGPTTFGGTSNGGSIAYDEGRVFAISWSGELTAFDAATGVVDWTSQLGNTGFFSSPPTAVGGTVYVGGGTWLYAVDETLGATKWRGGVSNGDESAPAVDDTGVYVSYACEQAYRFGLAGGLYWHHSTDCSGGGGNTAVLHDGRLYVRDNIKTPAVLDADSGEQLGTFDAGPAPAFDGRHMISVSDGVLTASDADTGDPIWRAPSDDAATTPLIVNGYVIEGLGDGTIEARDEQDGALAWTGQVGASFLGNTDVYGLAEGDGALVAPAGTTLTVFEPSATRVLITSGPPAGTVAGPRVTFAFGSAASDPRYICTLDGTTSPCTSPITYSGLDGGRHDFTVKVNDALVGAASRTFAVDAEGPVVTLDAFPHRVIHHSTVRGRWSAVDIMSGVRAYQLRARHSRLGHRLPSWSVENPTTQRAEIRHVPRDSRLCISVRAKDGVGNWSGWSSSRCVIRP
jgi:outer membrane protein assembly factor BamB